MAITTKTIDVPIYKTIKSGIKKKTLYVTDDGREFDREKDAISHQEVLDIMKKRLNLNSVIPYGDMPENNIWDSTWYYAGSQEELETIIDIFGGLKQKHYTTYINGYQYGYPQLRVGDWITCIANDDGDSYWTKSFYTLSHVKQEFNKFLSFFDKDE